MIINKKIQSARQLLAESQKRIDQATNAKLGIRLNESKDVTQSNASNEYEWITHLCNWADENHIPKYRRNFDTGGWYGLPRDKESLLRISELNLSNTPITHLPDELFELKSLETLNLYRCGLTELSEKIEKLQKLAHINLNENNLSFLPNTIVNLPSLHTLILYKNPMQRLPNGLINHPKLENLKMDGILATQYRRNYKG